MFKLCDDRDNLLDYAEIQVYRRAGSKNMYNNDPDTCFIKNADKNKA